MSLWQFKKNDGKIKEGINKVSVKYHASIKQCVTSK